jgi:hypothetical protein
MAQDDEAQARWKAAMEKLTKDLVDQGMLIEAGWLACRTMTLPRNAPSHQIDDCRIMFFAGAQHLFGCIMSGDGIMEPGDEPTEADERRVGSIQDELNRFITEFARKHNMPNPGGPAANPPAGKA